MAVSLANKVDSLVVADFDGDGLSDVPMNIAGDWMVSFGGANPWSKHTVSNGNECIYMGVTTVLGQTSPDFQLSRAPGVGRFDGTSASEDWPRLCIFGELDPAAATVRPTI